MLDAMWVYICINILIREKRNRTGCDGFSQNKIDLRCGKTTFCFLNQFVLCGVFGNRGP